MQIELGIILGDFVNLWGAFTAIACGLLTLFWNAFPGRYKAKPNQPSYPVLVALVSAIIMTIVMLLPFVIAIVIHFSIAAYLVEHIISEFLFYGAVFLAYVLVAMVGGWYYARLYPPTHEPIDCNGLDDHKTGKAWKP